MGVCVPALVVMGFRQLSFWGVIHVFDLRLFLVL